MQFSDEITKTDREFAPFFPHLRISIESLSWEICRLSISKFANVDQTILEKPAKLKTHTGKPVIWQAEEPHYFAIRL